MQGHLPIQDNDKDEAPNSPHITYDTLKPSLSPPMIIKSLDQASPICSTLFT